MKYLMALAAGLLLAASAALAGGNLYGLDREFSQVVNWKRFAHDVGGYRDSLVFSPEQRAKLIENGFVVVPERNHYPAEQFFYIYESDHYGMVPVIPNFVSVDCALQAYHLYFNYVLQQIEGHELRWRAERFATELFEASAAQYDSLPDGPFKAAALKNIAYFLVAVQALDDKAQERLDQAIRESRANSRTSGSVTFLSPTIPLEAARIAQDEFEAVRRHEGRAASALFPTELDYTQFVPRGHYTRNSNLESYFLAMMWFGLGSFPARISNDSVDNARCDECIMQALLMTDAMFAVDDMGYASVDYWDDIDQMTAAFAGQSDFVTPHDLKRIRDEVYPQPHTLAILTDAAKFEQFAQKFERLKPPAIRQQAAGLASGIQFRLMGQRYILDSEILQTLSDPGARPFPKGLDVLAVLGSDRAAEILDKTYNEGAKWPEYLIRRDTLERAVTSWRPRGDTESLYHSWLDVLRELIKPLDPRAPKFTQTTAWTDKELTTALASWAEGRHDIILYANASYAEGGDGQEKPPEPKGYVEPMPRVFAKLGDLIELTRAVPRIHHCFGSDNVEQVGMRLTDLVRFLQRCAQQELDGVPLARGDYARIQYIGSELEQLAIDIINIDPQMPAYDWEGRKVEMEPHPLRGWFEVTGPERAVAEIADVHTSLDSCLEVATGYVDEAFVILPVDGRLNILRGGVFSYHEFNYPTGHRLTDEAWQDMLQRGRAPERPAWMNSFIAR
jgi:hypothetical protein